VETFVDAGGFRSLEARMIAARDSRRDDRLGGEAPDG
jgi:hypothetical protein